MRTYKINYTEYNPVTKDFIGIGTLTINAENRDEGVSSALIQLKDEGKLAILKSIQHITEKYKEAMLTGIATTEAVSKKIQ